MTGITNILYLISNFRRVLNVIFFAFGSLPGVWILFSDFSEHSVGSIFIGGVSRKNNWDKLFLWRWNRQSVPKRRQIKFRSRWITQKQEYNYNILYNIIINTTSVTFCCFQIFCCKYFHMFYYISVDMWWQWPKTQPSYNVFILQFVSQQF
jgi:hypothetical protein